MSFHSIPSSEENEECFREILDEINSSIVMQVQKFDKLFSPPRMMVVNVRYDVITFQLNHFIPGLVSDDDLMTRSWADGELGPKDG